MAPLQFDNPITKKAFRFLKVLDNKPRIEILKAIHINNGMTVTELYTQLKQEQSVISQHLKILREGAFVITNRKGKNVYYTIDYNRLEKVIGLIRGIINEPAREVVNKPVPLSLSEYRAYVLEMMDVYKPMPQVMTYKGMRAWLKSFSQMLKAYNAATLKKEREILQEAEDNLEIDLKRLRAELEKIRTNALRAYIKKYKS